MIEYPPGMELHRIDPGSTVDLDTIDPSDTPGFAEGKAAAKDTTKQLNERLEALQELLYAEGKHKVLVVLQATDTGGKDGTIRHVFDGVNPQGVKVASFKKPTPEELSHDYLWRVHAHTPGSGEITIFNRSHYEDVLVVRVHSLVDEGVWSRRYDHINEFEKMLADEGTTILKFFLHISRDEQKQRLQDRLDRPDKQWKFSRGDLAERARWDDYRLAFETMLQRTSTPWAPWYVVPANRKWYRNLVISRVLVDTLEGLDMRFPQPEDGLDDRDSTCASPSPRTGSTTSSSTDSAQPGRLVPSAVHPRCRGHPGSARGLNLE
jgi:PPK2 family polyphosphate:nucleotide phosphotransferase